MVGLKLKILSICVQILVELIYRTEEEPIYTANWQMLIFGAKKSGAGGMGWWVGGWAGGWMDEWMEKQI